MGWLLVPCGNPGMAAISWYVGAFGTLYEGVGWRLCCSSLQTAPRVRLSTTPRKCPLKSRTLTSFPQLHTALLQVSTQRPWTSHCNNKKQITIKQCKDTLQALANTRGIFKACLLPACSLSLFCMQVLGNQDRKGLQGHGVQSPATCPFRSF